jgi:hypothetical protein
VCLFLFILQVVQHEITDYERRRDKQVEENIKKMQDLGLNKYTYVLNKSLPPYASTKGKNAANKKTNSSDSDSYVSVYLLDDDDQGDTDDGDTESYEQPQPLLIKVLLLSSK